MSNISNKRKATYYIGLAMTGIGFLLFISTFFIGFNTDPFYPGTTQNPIGNAVIGMMLMIAGGIVSSIGAKGAAGSGLILDPEKAVEDLKPYNTAAGEMINDVVGQVDAVSHLTGGTAQSETREIIRIKCRECGSLNEEDAKFCKACGREL